MSQETKNKIRQSDNLVEIEGILESHDIEIRETATGKKSVSGKLDIKTGENSVHSVKVFSYLKKDDGTDNGIAKGLITVMEEYKTIKDHGENDADKIRINKGEYRRNEYIGQDGDFKSYPELQTNFVNRLKPQDTYNPRARFAIDTYIQSITPEMKNGEETGRILIKGLTVNYSGKVVPVEYVVAEEKNIAYIERNYEVGETINFKGVIINSITTEKRIEEVDFGEPEERITTTTVREFLVTGGTKLTEEKSYSAEDMKNALVERDIYVDSLKEKAKEKKTSGSQNKGKSTGMSDFGEGSFSNGGSTGEEIDIPF